MKSIFDLNSPLVRGLGKIADLMVLNILYLISCIPIFTIGAANAALYDVTTRLAKDDATVWRNYWQAFGSNFKKATLLWLVLLLFACLIYGSSIFYWSYDLPNKNLCVTLLAIVSVVWWCAYSWTFPLQARFENTVKQTLMNALLFSWSYIPKTVLIAILNTVPAMVFVFLPAVLINYYYIFLIIWFSLSAYLSTLLLRKNMAQLEELASNE